MSEKIAFVGAGCALGSLCWGQIKTPELFYKLRGLEYVKRYSLQVDDFGSCNETRWLREESNPRLKNFEAISQYQSKLFQFILAAHKNYDRMLVLGGDHSISIASIAARIKIFKERFPQKKIAIVWIDAHADINTEETTPSGKIHGMILSSLLGMGPIDLQKTFSMQPVITPEDIIYLGLRSVDEGEQRFIKENNIFAIYNEDIKRDGLKESLNRIRNYLALNDYHFIASYDVDICDPVAMPAVATIEPDGISLMQAREIASWIAESKLCVGIDFVELDADHTYAEECLRFALELMAAALGS